MEERVGRSISHKCLPTAHRILVLLVVRARAARFISSLAVKRVVIRKCRGKLLSL